MSDAVITVVLELDVGGEVVDVDVNVVGATVTVVDVPDWQAGSVDDVRSLSPPGSPVGSLDDTREAVHGAPPGLAGPGRDAGSLGRGLGPPCPPDCVTMSG